MNLRTFVPQNVNTRARLLPYALSLVIAMVVIQAVIALTGGQITVLAGLLTAAVAVGIAVWLWYNRLALLHVRFGGAMVHAIAFVTITTSFNAHAVLRAIALGGQPDGLQTVAQDFLATGWFGATLVMSSAWGLGLLLHLIGVIVVRGWED